MNTYTDYIGKPILIDATTAHTSGTVVYEHDGTVLLKDDRLHALLGVKEVRIPTQHQYSCIFPTFIDLNKSLSRLSNSPLTQDGKSIREKFDEEFAHYRDLVTTAQKQGKWEPDFGTYVFDYVDRNLYLIAPEYWHRLGLYTNNSKLVTDPHAKMTWREIREVFDNAVIGFAGASVGGNILEGWIREGRPKAVKVADLDWEEITNLNRLERGSLRHLVQSRAHKSDPKNPFEVLRKNKAEISARENNLIDPYATWYVYADGLNADTIDQFLLGADGEPKIDILLEEIDNFTLKYELREKCREYGIPVMMLSDFGHMVQGQMQDFKHHKNLPLGYKTTDEEVKKRLDHASSTGERKDVFDFVRALCGDAFDSDEFGDWVKGVGEQPTSSLPQSGATAMASGGVGGKLIALYLLGHKLPERFVLDMKNLKLLLG